MAQPETPPSTRTKGARLAQSAKPDPIVLLFTVDDNYAMPMAVTLFSIVDNLKPGTEVVAYVFDGGIKPASKERIDRVVNRRPGVRLEYINADMVQFDAYDLKIEKRFTKSIFLRLIAPELIDVSKAIYLDTDMIVDADISEIWNAEMGDHAMLAVAERTVSCPIRGLFNWKELGLNADDPYFNSGLMVMNMERWRKEGVGRKVLSYLEQHGENLRMKGNQEGLNAVMAGQWGQLDVRWNIISSYYDLKTYGDDILKHPYVIHYTKRKKPWHHDCTHPLKGRFRYYFKRSGWFTPNEYLKWRLELLPKEIVEEVWQFTRKTSKPYREAIRRAMFRQPGSSKPETSPS